MTDSQSCAGATVTVIVEVVEETDDRTSEPQPHIYTTRQSPVPNEKTKTDPVGSTHVRVLFVFPIRQAVCTNLMAQGNTSSLSAECYILNRMTSSLSGWDLLDVGFLRNLVLRGTTRINTCLTNGISNISSYHFSSTSTGRLTLNQTSTSSAVISTAIQAQNQPDEDSGTLNGKERKERLSSLAQISNILILR